MTHIDGSYLENLDAYLYEIERMGSKIIFWQRHNLTRIALWEIMSTDNAKKISWNIVTRYPEMFVGDAE